MNYSPEDGGSTALRNVGILPQHYKTSHPEDHDLNLSHCEDHKFHIIRMIESWRISLAELVYIEG